MLEIKTFGGLSLELDGKRISPLGSHKAEAIAVFLAVEGGRHQRSVIAAKLWPDSNASDSQTALRVTLSLLRKSLQEYVLIDRETIGLNPESTIWLDADELERHLDEGRAAEALALYRGDFLEGFHVRGSLSFEDWCVWQQERYHRLMVDALHKAISRVAAAGSYQHGGELALKLLELDPLDELGHRQQMQLLALDGQRNAALLRYEALRTILRAELDVEPSEDSRRLYEQIAAGQLPFAAEAPPHRPRFPLQDTTFIGREQEMADLCSLLRRDTCRIVTLAGLGGIGKTRLALEIVRAVADDFPDGVYFAPLTAVVAPEYLLPAIGSALDFDFDGLASDLDPRQQLADYLVDRSLLLVLDSFEHLVGEAPLLCDLIAHAPGVKLLVTSRERLDLHGEWVFLLEGLPVPSDDGGSSDLQADALVLFLDRARRAGGKVSMCDQQADVARICRLVGGMPLAIELAAAWTSVLSCAEIADEIEKNMEVLTAHARDVPERHRSLQAVFDHTWHLLMPEQRDALARLSVFRGGFDRRAATRVAGADLALLATLVKMSLLTRNAANRFDLHPLLRRYAAQRLSESAGAQDSVHDRHSRFFIEFLFQREDYLMGKRMVEVREEIRAELANVQAAVEWAVVQGHDSLAMRGFGGLLAYYGVADWHEGRIAFGHIADLRSRAAARKANGNEDDPVYLSARVREAFFCSHLGLVAQSEAISQECHGRLRDLGLQAELGLCLHNFGLNAALRGECYLAEEYLTQAIPIGRESGEFAWPTYALWLGYTYFLRGEYQRALAELEESRQVFANLGSQWGQAFALSKMGLAADGVGDYSHAMQFHRQALAMFERTEHKVGQAYTLSRMSVDAYGLEAYQEAADLAQAASVMFLELSHRWGVCGAWCRLGFAAVGLGDLAEAERYCCDALRLAWDSQIIPLTLYALTGLACVAVRRGAKARAAILLALVQQHPQMPALYLELASRWLTEPIKLADQAVQEVRAGPDCLSPIAAIVEQILGDTGGGECSVPLRGLS